MTKTWTRVVATAAASVVTSVGLLTVGSTAAQAATPTTAAPHTAHASKVTRKVTLAVTRGKRYQVKVRVPASKKTHAKVAIKVNKNTRSAKLNNKGAATLSTTTLAVSPQLAVSVTIPAGLGRNVSVTAIPLPGPTAGTPVVSATIPASGSAGSSSSGSGASTSGGSVAGGIAAFSGHSVTWKSGVTPDAISNSAANAFAAYRGKANDIISAFPERASWDQIRTGNWVVNQYAGNPATLALGIALLPDTNGGTLADVAAGKHDADFLGNAHNLVAAGRGNSDLRIGWEFNGDWMTWSASDPATFIAAFRHVAGLYKSVSPSFRIIWNGNIGGNQCGHDAFTELYPGDDVVDGIGVDVYDIKYWAVTDAASFANVVTMDDGLGAWASFAASHHKGLSVPEWGLNGAVGQAQPGDQVAFVQGMHDWFASLGGALDFEAYFDDPADYQRSSLVTAGQNPASAAVYSHLWSL